MTRFNLSQVTILKLSEQRLGVNHFKRETVYSSEKRESGKLSQVTQLSTTEKRESGKLFHLERLTTTEKRDGGKLRNLTQFTTTEKRDEVDA